MKSHEQLPVGLFHEGGYLTVPWCSFKQAQAPVPAQQSYERLDFLFRKLPYAVLAGAPTGSEAGAVDVPLVIPLCGENAKRNATLARCT